MLATSPMGLRLTKDALNRNIDAPGFEAALALVRAREADLMRAFAAGQGCLMRFLQEALDDPAPSNCGRCSVCTGQLPGPGARPDAARVEAARVYARGQDVVIEPRKPPHQYRYTRRPYNQEDGLDDAPTVDPALGDEALAHALWPSWAYREERYKLPAGVK
mgnify:CR=1 FL=1